MKVVILAGGYGTRISEESGVRPKPMVEIGEMPIIWHIMKIYSHYGITEFIICCGYKGYVIKEYFANYFLHTSDVTFNLQTNEMEVHQNSAEPWKVTLIDTGEGTMTGGRLKRVKDYIGNETFCMTYGDGVSDVNIANLIDFHKQEKGLATLTAAQPPGRFGAFSLPHNQTHIPTFKEKPEGDGAWVNSGFFVLEPSVMDYIAEDITVWEKEPLERLAQERQLSAFKHHGFWQPMDSLRDKNVLENLWDGGNPPWKVW
jgi:glucose-1-phosphate cytidylyltransferase